MIQVINSQPVVHKVPLTVKDPYLGMLLNPVLHVNLQVVVVVAAQNALVHFMMMYSYILS